MRKFFLLDAFRGLAILGIVPFHILRSWRETYNIFFKVLIENGDLGVQIFFVISGFCVFASLKKISLPLSILAGFEFFKKKVFRIYGPFLVSLLFAALIIPTITSYLPLLKGKAVSFDFFNYSLIDWVQIVSLTRAFCLKNWSLGSSLGLNEAFLPINGALWFLAIIVQIYLVISLSLFFGKSYVKIIIAVTALALLTFNSPTLFFIPIGLFLPFWKYFIIGILVFFITDRYDKFLIDLSEKKIYFVFLCLFFVLSAALLKLFFSRLLFSCLIGACFILLHPLDDSFKNNTAIRFFSFLGSFSFSAYLMHIPFWRLVDCFTRNVGLPGRIVDPFLTVPCVFFLCYIWYLFFEKPGSFINSINALKHPLATLTLH